MRGRPRKNPIARYPNRIRTIREDEERISQRELARRVRMKPQTVSRYETGERELKVTQLALFARALNRRAFELLPDETGLTALQRAVLDLMSRLSVEDQERLLRVAQAFERGSAAVFPQVFEAPRRAGRDS